MKIRHLHGGWIKALLAEELVSGLSRNSVRIIHATLRAVLNAAVDDAGMWRTLRSGSDASFAWSSEPGERQEAIKAFTRDQLMHFLATAAEEKATGPRSSSR